ncbi:hypothetical protein L3Q82_007872 [Scortum barcoo]|uniref:Uncharacterized protein n=1 Tax=Scortum barcoo TaxID=214431 RepID=A0ACB8WKE7_9TELE|nr:hypothetical protein L3Q82_007872 [Scortum barcoo]
MLLRSKEIQEQMRKKVIEIYQSGKGYKAISKAANHNESHYSQMVKTWSSGEPSQEWPADQNYPKERSSDDSSKRSQKTPQQHPKNCRPHMPQLRSVFMTPPIRKRLGKNGLHGRVPRRKPLLSKKKALRLVSILPENILMIPKTFGKILCGLT